MKPHLFVDVVSFTTELWLLGKKDSQGDRNGMKTNGWITIVGEGHTDYCACFQERRGNCWI